MFDTRREWKVMGVTNRKALQIYLHQLSETGWTVFTILDSTPSERNLDGYDWTVVAYRDAARSPQEG